MNNNAFVKKHREKNKILIAFLALLVAGALLATFFALFTEGVTQNSSVTLFYKPETNGFSSRTYKSPESHDAKQKDVNIANILPNADSAKQQNSNDGIPNTWTEKLISPLTNEEILALPSTLLHAISNAVKDSDTLFYTLLDALSTLPHNEHRFLLLNILSAGREDQLITASETLLYTDNTENINAAIQLSFNIKAKEAQMHVINSVFSLNSDSVDVTLLLRHLANKENRQLAERFSNDIYAIYQFSSDQNAKYEAFKVLLKNTDFSGISLGDFLSVADHNNKTQLLSLARSLLFSNEAKISDKHYLETQLHHIADNADEQTINRQIAQDILAQM